MKTTIVQATYDDKGYPHLGPLLANRGDARIILATDDRDKPPMVKWRSADEFYRYWWRKHRPESPGDRVVFFENDTCLLAPVPDRLRPEGIIAVRKQLTRRERRKVRERNVGAGNMQEAFGPLGVMIFHPSALDLLAKDTPYVDRLYTMNFFSETRLAIAARHLRIKVEPLTGDDRWPMYNHKTFAEKLEAGCWYAHHRKPAASVAQLKGIVGDRLPGVEVVV